jgi:hypothetical protein
VSQRSDLSWRALAQWLAQVDALTVYPESCLYTLGQHGIDYDPSVPLLRVMTHNFWWERGNPFSSLRIPQVMTPRALMEELARQQLSLQQLADAHDERLILGAMLLQDIWALMKVETPPVVFDYTKMAATYAAALYGGSR